MNGRLEKTYPFDQEKLLLFDVLIGLLSHVDLSVEGCLLVLSVLVESLNKIRCLLLDIITGADRAESGDMLEKVLNGVQLPALLQVVSSEPPSVGCIVQVALDEMCDVLQSLGVIEDRIVQCCSGVILMLGH